ncbi:MAG: hypothetical protein KJO69_03855 [Gammaproteobacteria bacterium]|nr:hypothetical protein [Gammaproteobacteria bacterium]
MSITDNVVRTVIDNNAKAWHYYDGVFWSVVTWKGKKVLLSANTQRDGNIDIDIKRQEINSYKVTQCERHHLDFVNAVFGTEFGFRRNNVSAFDVLLNAKSAD